MKLAGFGPKRILKWLAVSFFAFYLIQLSMVVFWEFLPMEQRNHEGIQYEMRRGFGFPFALIPLAGVTPIVFDEPVRLTVIDPMSGVVREESYDVPYDVYSRYEKVWPGKLRP